MRIIKGDLTEDQLIKIIAGEMLNIETSTFHFLDGEPREEFSNYDGYPQFNDGPIVNTMRAAQGRIYLPMSYRKDLNIFINRLELALETMRATMVRPDGKPVVHLDNYQYISGISSRLKVKSSQTGVTLRKITCNPRSGSSRFTWTVQKISKILMVVTSANILEAVSAHCNSVFYDHDDAMVHSHNDVVFDVSGFRGLNNLTTVNMTLVENRNPLLIELGCSRRVKFSNIPPILIKQADLDTLTIRPKFVNGTPRYDICINCDEPLYDEIYALYKNVGTVDLFCPICCHSYHLLTDLVVKYDWFIRTTYPKTIDEKLSSKQTSREFYMAGKEALKGIAKVDSTYLFYNIGEKYAMFTSARKYLFAGKHIQQQAGNRKIIFGRYEKICEGSYITTTVNRHELA